MEESVRVSLDFPRSGQRLHVSVPRRLAQSAMLFTTAVVTVRMQARRDEGGSPRDDGPGPTPQ